MTLEEQVDKIVKHSGDPLSFPLIRIHILVADNINEALISPSEYVRMIAGKILTTPKLQEAIEKARRHREATYGNYSN